MQKMRWFMEAKPWLRKYEGEDPPPGDPPPPPVPPGKEEAKFTQAQVNKILAEDRRKHEDKIKQTVTQLEELKKAKGLSEEDKGRLEQQIEEYKNSLLSKEEQQKRELAKKDKEYGTKLQATEQEKDAWRARFAQESTRNQIIMAAKAHGAVSEGQMLEFLLPKAQLTEVLQDGKGTGQYVPKIKYKGKTDKGEELELDLTIEEYMKRMKDDTDNYGNLFTAGLNGGLGGGGSIGGGSGAAGDRPPADPRQYRIWREKRGITSRK